MSVTTGRTPLDAVFLSALLWLIIRFGDEGCLVMCDGIAGNYVLQYLSMDFCGLTPAVGEKLGQAILTSGIR